MYEMRSCVTFYLLNRFPQPNDNCTSWIDTSWNDLIQKFVQDIHGFIFNWTFLKFLDFYEKIALYKEQDLQKLFWRTRKILNIFKNVPERRKNFKAIWVVLAHSKPKTFSVGQPWWPTFFWEFGPRDYFSAATALLIKNHKLE